MNNRKNRSGTSCQDKHVYTAKDAFTTTMQLNLYLVYSASYKFVKRYCTYFNTKKKC